MAPILRRESNPLAEFFYANFDSLMQAAQEFCDKHGLVLETSYFSGNHMARAFPGSVEFRDWIIWDGSEDRSKALMQACIEAAGKLKARAT